MANPAEAVKDKEKKVNKATRPTLRVPKVVGTSLKLLRTAKAVKTAKPPVIIQYGKRISAINPRAGEE